jgi:hypothetical protein
MASPSRCDLATCFSHHLPSQDVKLIMPTLLILLFTLLIMVTVIPYAFASVFRQLEAVRALEAMAGTDTGLF